MRETYECIDGPLFGQMRAAPSPGCGFLDYAEPSKPMTTPFTTGSEAMSPTHQTIKVHRYTLRQRGARLVWAIAN
jgi:hypothetical protein